jgi:hypothetical protein
MSDDMREEYDFSKGERGKFYQPGAGAQIPVYLSDRLQEYLLQIAERKGTTLNELVNDLLERELSIVEAMM